MTTTPHDQDAASRLQVTLFDYGVGNLHSIKKALERSGAHVTVTQDPHELLKAEAIVLPGVGAFGATMASLESIRAPLKKRLEEGTPCLAVCIGMQLLFESSEESPGVPGIGLLPGQVRTLPRQVGKIPHLGWNTLTPHDPSPQDTKTDWASLVPPEGTYTYFVHSYYAPKTPGLLATTHYGPDPIEIPAVITRYNTFATQFHPEKSSKPGLRLIQQWVERTRALQKKTRPGSTGPPETPEKRQKGPEGKH